MAIVRYNPWADMDAFQQHLNKVFNEVLTPANVTDFGNYSKVPAAELVDTETALILKLELPGMNVADINIEATAKSVSISGERQSTATEANKTRSEFRYGSFARVIPLPVQIQNTEVKAEYKDGILILNLPKAEAEKNKVVKVNLAE